MGGAISSLRQMRMFAVAIALVAILPACESGMQGQGGSAALTPQQQQLRDQSSDWNQSARWYTTMATGALVGAASGAALGAVESDHSPVLGAVIGAGIGFLAGALAGAIVADRTMTFEKQEVSVGLRIQSAQEIAARLQQTAVTSERVTAENWQKLEMLNQRYRAGQLTIAQYRAETETMRQDVEVMRRTAGEAHEARQRLVASAQDQPQLMTEEFSIGTAQRRLEQSVSELEAALRQIPLG